MRGLSKLLVIIPDRLSVLVKKGEITERYYNPGGLFDEVHILMTNDDRVDPAAVQKTVGSAQLYLHNLPAGSGLFLRSLGWQPWLLKFWAEPAVALAREIRPALIRCHGNYLNAYAACRIKEALGTPYVVSLHTTLDEDPRGGEAGGWKERISTLPMKALERMAAQATKSMERMSLSRADVVLPVYESIIPYARRMGAENIEVAYNALNPEFLREKEDYSLHQPVRVLSVGRQMEGKNPDNLIRAVKMLPGVHLTLVGDGTHHDHLREVARECQLEGRVTFHRAIPNDDLCAQLADYDIFATHNDYWGVPKAVMEPLLAGLPVVMNERVKSAVVELQGDFLLLVENTAEGYYRALRRLIEDDPFREQLGRRAYAHAQELWAPAKAEAKFVEIYKRVMAEASDRR
jgi:glycosyltransferase involved in cell wall biosynthesis